MRFSRSATPCAFLLLALVACNSPRKERSRAQPHFPITDYGAVVGGVAMNTAAIQKAIDTAAAAGGGVVDIPAGVFRSGSIFLKQGVELHLAADAVLQGSANVQDYPKQLTRVEGHFEPWRLALVNAQGMTGVRISGPGRLDGSGPGYWRTFWQGRKENPKITNLAVERPRLMLIDRCTDVKITDLALQDSGYWNLHLYRCRDVILEGLRITLPSASATLHGPSTDGIDVDSSQNVTIRRCYISTDDDNIALKGSKGPHADQDTNSPPVENILVEDCEIGEGNGLITCGSEATVVRHVLVRNCVMSGRATMLTIKLRPDTPQHYEDITFDGIRLAGNGRIISMAPWKQFFDLQGQPAPTRTVNNITLRNITGTYRMLGSLEGNPGDTLRDFTLENFDVKLKDDRFMVGKVDNLVLKNVMVNGRPLARP